MYSHSKKKPHCKKGLISPLAGKNKNPHPHLQQKRKEKVSSPLIFEKNGLRNE